MVNSHGTSQAFPSAKQAEEAYYIKLAYDYLGSAIRDNSRQDKIYHGFHRFQNIKSTTCP